MAMEKRYEPGGVPSNQTVPANQLHRNLESRTFQSSHLAAPSPAPVLHSLPAPPTRSASFAFVLPAAVHDDNVDDDKAFID